MLSLAAKALCDCSMPLSRSRSTRSRLGWTALMSSRLHESKRKIINECDTTEEYARKKQSSSEVSRIELQGGCGKTRKEEKRRRRIGRCLESFQTSALFVYMIIAFRSCYPYLPL